MDKCKNKFKNLLIYDIYMGSLNRGLSLIICGIVFVFIAFKAHAEYTYNYVDKAGSVIVGIADIIIYNFWGMKEFIPENKEPLIVPAVLLAFIICLITRTSLYPAISIKKTDINIIYHLNKKSELWTSKVVWCIFENIIYLIMYIVIVVICSIVINDGKIVFRGNAAINNYNLDYNLINIGNMIKFLGVVFLTMCFATVLSIFIAMIINIMVSYITIFSLFVCSCYYYTNMFIFNNCMICRNNLFVKEGFGNIPVVIIVILGFIVIYISGIIYFRKKDIYW